MLKIKSKTEPRVIKNLVVTIYSQPGAGKTSTAFTAKNPILFDFDKGAYRSACHGDTVEIDYWEDVLNLSGDDLKDYDTVVIDTVGRALDCLTDFIIRSNSRARNNSTGTLSQQGWGVLKMQFNDWLKRILILGKDVVLLAHGTEQMTNGGDNITNRLDIQGSTKNEIYKVSDMMGIIRFEGKQRVLDFTPSDAGFGKNPVNLQPMNIPDFSDNPHFLAQVIEEAKKIINDRAKEVLERQIAAETDIEAIKSLKTLDDFNQIFPTMTDKSVAVKRYLLSQADALGFTFDKSGNQFVEKAAA